MIQEANDRNYRNKQITDDKILHRMIVSPDVKKIQDELKAKDQAKRKAKPDGKLRKSK